jgi:hypothetical protein
MVAALINREGLYDAPQTANCVLERGATLLVALDVDVQDVELAVADGDGGLDALPPPRAVQLVAILIESNTVARHAALLIQ